MQPAQRTCVLAEVKALEAAVGADGAVHVQAHVQRRGACRRGGQVAGKVQKRPGSRGRVHGRKHCIACPDS